jgi:tRNA-dihydrouridine synthase
MILEHRKSLIDFKGEHLAMLQMRGQGSWYFKGLHNAKETKDRLSKVKTWSEFVEIIHTYFDQEIENQKEMTLI